MATLSNLAAVEVLAQQRATTTVTGGDVDFKGYVQNRQLKAILAIKSQGTDTDESCIVKLQESDDTAVANFADIAGAVFPTHTQETATTLYSMHFTMKKRYLRAIATLAGTTIAFDLALAVLAEKRSS